MQDRGFYTVEQAADTLDLSLAGNRKLNYALHMVATCQARSDVRGGAYYRKKIDEGKSLKEASRPPCSLLKAALWRWWASVPSRGKSCTWGRR